MRRLSTFVFAAAVSCLSLSTPARAQDSSSGSPSGNAAAEALFQQGRALLAEGKTAEACERFAGSQRLEAKLGTLLNLAVCHERLGLHATAWAEFTSAATLAEREGQAERQAFAQGRVAALQAKLSTLTLTLSSPVEGASVTLDGQAFPAIGVPLPVDPGAHRLVVSAPGKQPWEQSIQVTRERQALEIHVPPLADDGAPAEPSPPAAPPTPSRPPSPDTTEGTRDGGGIPTVSIVAFAVGGVGLVVGTATGIASLGMTSDIEDDCAAGLCPVDRQGDIDSANAMANVSNVSFVLAAVAAGVGVGAILLADDPKKVATLPHVEPTVGLGTLGARGTF